MSLNWHTAPLLYHYKTFTRHLCNLPGQQPLMNSHGPSSRQLTCKATLPVWNIGGQGEVDKVWCVRVQLVFCRLSFSTSLAIYVNSSKWRVVDSAVNIHCLEIREIFHFVGSVLLDSKFLFHLNQLLEGNGSFKSMMAYIAGKNN